jgi:hypothetical protein
MEESVALTRSFWLIVHSDIRDLARVRVLSDFIAKAVRTERHLFQATVPGDIAV